MTVAGLDGLGAVEQSDFMNVIAEREDGSHFFVTPAVTPWVSFHARTYSFRPLR